MVGVRIALASANPTAVKTLVSKAYETRVGKDAGPKASRAGKRESGP